MRLRPSAIAIWEAQGKRCAICGASMVPVSARRWTIEHVYPRSRYFLYSEGNQLISHDRCNNAKGDRDPTGCEIILLHAVNAKLGLEIEEKPRCYVDPTPIPSPLAVALRQALAA